MVSAPEYSVRTQAKLVHAICLLHNFIRIHDPDDCEPVVQDAEEHLQPAEGAQSFGGPIQAAERAEATLRRDQIAKEMWESYVTYMENQD